MNPLALWKAASLLQRIGVTIGILIALAAAWKLFWWQHDRGVIADHEAKVGEAVASQSASASASASAAASETKAGVEAGNAKAREAAAKSSDPLRDGLNALPRGSK